MGRAHLRRHGDLYDPIGYRAGEAGVIMKPSLILLLHISVELTLEVLRLQLKIENA